MKTRLSEAILEGIRTRSTSRRGRGSRGAAAAPGLDRWLRSNAGALTFAGLTLGVFVSRKFLVLPVAALAGLLAEGARGVVERASGSAAS